MMQAKRAEGPCGGTDGSSSSSSSSSMQGSPGQNRLGRSGKVSGRALYAYMAWTLARTVWQTYR